MLSQRRHFFNKFSSGTFCTNCCNTLVPQILYPAHLKFAFVLLHTMVPMLHLHRSTLHTFYISCAFIILLIHPLKTSYNFTEAFFDKPPPYMHLVYISKSNQPPPYNLRDIIHFSRVTAPWLHLSMSHHTYSCLNIYWTS